MRAIEELKIVGGNAITYILKRIKAMKLELESKIDSKSDFSGDFNDLTNKPEKLPNPNSLTFTGAQTGSYDGSEPVTIDIPFSNRDIKPEEIGAIPKTAVTDTFPVTEDGKLLSGKAVSDAFDVVDISGGSMLTSIKRSGWYEGNNIAELIGLGYVDVNEWWKIYAEYRRKDGGISVFCAGNLDHAVSFTLGPDGFIGSLFPYENANRVSSFFKQGINDINNVPETSSPVLFYTNINPEGLPADYNGNSLGGFQFGWGNWMAQLVCGFGTEALFYRRKLGTENWSSFKTIPTLDMLNRIPDSIVIMMEYHHDNNTLTFKNPFPDNKISVFIAQSIHIIGFLASSHDKKQHAITEGYSLEFPDDQNIIVKGTFAWYTNALIIVTRTY